MADNKTKKQRSFNMSMVKSKGTKPELQIINALNILNLKYKLHDQYLPGKPDIIIPNNNTVLFIHGCFWHQHKSCKKAKLPQTNTKFWKTKLKNNTIRDRNNIKALQRMGWNVIILWECEILKANPKDLLQRKLSIKSETKEKI